MSSAQDVRDAITELTKNQAKLQDVVSELVSGLSTTKSVGKPQNYNGKRGEDARRFLAAFELWANSIPALSMDRKKKITSAITYLEGDAAIWATPISETINRSSITGSGVAFPYDTWEEFVTAFKTHFETTDASADAKQPLKRLYQNRTTVGTYASTFQQYADCTGYSDKDLRDRFYNHLADRVKDGLVFTTCPTGSLQELIEAAIDVDN